MNTASLLPDWRAGGRVVTTRHEHAGALGPLYALRDRLGIDSSSSMPVPMATTSSTIAAFDAAITAGTRLVSISHVLWTTGAVMPVARIAEIAHARGALVVVDGAQAAGAIPVRFDDLGADLYAIPAQKWLLGPEGMGALSSIRREVDRLVAGVRRLLDFEHGSTWPATRPGGPMPGGSSRAASTGRRWSAWPARSAGCRCTSGSISSIAAGHGAGGRGGGASGRDPRRRPADPARHAMATLVTFRIDGWAAAGRPRRARVADLRDRPNDPALDALRISVGFFTSEDELERFAAAVELLAAHTPETIPPRRTLTILGEG